MTNSHDIKLACLGYLRFIKQMPYVATEFQYGLSFADVFACDDKLSIEVEVKVSKSDFCHDFTKSKHDHIERGAPTWYPNKLYYAVPASISDWALRALEAREPVPGLEENKPRPYGLISYNDSNEGYLNESQPWKRLLVVRKAGWLHREPTTAMMKEKLLLRMGSEIFGYALASRGFASLREAVVSSLNKAMTLSPEEIQECRSIEDNASAGPEPL